MACTCSFTAAPSERLARSAALAWESRLVVCVQHYTKVFKDDKWAIHYYAPIRGHELVTRCDLVPDEPDHRRAGQWYFKLQLGPLEHKLPPIVANRWRRVTYIVTNGDRFMNAHEINDPFEQESPASYT